MKEQRLIHFRINTGTYDDFVNHIIEKTTARQSTVVCVANVHMFVEAKRSKSYTNILDTADIITPDGKPLTWALKLLNGISQERVAGMDLFPSLLQASEATGQSVYFFGGSERMLEKLLAKVKSNFPSLHIAGHYSPPFRTLTAAEQCAIIETIKQAKPHLLFVALGCPKQEIWMHEMKEELNTVMVGVGGALPVYAGMQKRAPKWMQKGGLEWLYRLGQEPRRLFKRYAITNSLFLWMIFKELLTQKFSRSKSSGLPDRDKYPLKNNTSNLIK